MEARLYEDDYDEYNCEDFETWEEARDGDGIPCEALR